jgi:hypothetical protein
MLRAAILSVAMLRAAMLRAAMLSVILLSVILLSVVKLIVVPTFCYAECHCANNFNEQLNYFSKNIFFFTFLSIF